MLNKTKKFLHWWSVFAKYILMSDDSLLYKIAVLMPWMTLSILEPIKKYKIYNYLYNYFSRNAYYTLHGIKYKLTDIESLAVASPIHEPWMQHYLNCNNEIRVFIDVGAHIGKHTLFFAKKCPQGLAIAIEPHPENFRALIEGIKANNLRNVIPINRAAWSEETTLRFFIHQESVLHSIKRSSKKYILVKTITIDKLLNKLNIHEVHIMKIDVEGAEYEVLLGASETLRRYHPRIIIEIFPENRNNVFRFLQELGYHLTAKPDGLNYIFDFEEAHS